MNSRIFLGHVAHSREAPARHSFRYPLYVFSFDLDELVRLDRHIPLFGYNRFRPSAIHDRDYLDAGMGSIRSKLTARLRPAGLATPIGQIFLVTSARYFNYVFNPVSFFFCFGEDANLACVVAEVNNTYGERHLYVLDHQLPPAGREFARFSAEKAFHVSPFNDLRGTYEFVFADIRRELDISIRLIRDDRQVFSAHLEGRPLAFTAANHLGLLLRHPIVAHLSLPRIYKEAFRLYFRRKLEFHDKPRATHPLTIRKSPPGGFQRLGQRLTLAALKRIAAGRLNIALPDGTTLTVGGRAAGEEAELIVNDARFFSRVATGGDIGLGESYVEGEWDSPDLVGLFRLFIDNREALSEGNPITSVATRLMERMAHRKRRNTPRGSRRNIPEHYDLGNDFYRLFLDRTMTYSCAVFEHPDDPLEDAQQNKFRKIIEKTRIAAGDHVLEIGCGWGGFAVEAARRTGCRVTGITISEAQHRFAVERVRSLGLSQQIDIRLADYRSVDGRFDKIVSIEMLEAVGHEFFGRFLRQCDHLLKPLGLCLLQSITIPDNRYAAYRKQRDWIQKHIFPGGHLPSLSVISRTLTRHTDLMIEDVENIGPHYALTLHRWRRRFVRRRGEVEALGFDERFFRKWVYYLSICEAGFARRALGDLQILLTRPQNPRLPGWNPE